MTNHLFPYGREGFLDGSIDWDTNTIRLTLIDRDNYKISGGSVHRFYGVVTPLAARVKVSDVNALLSKTVTSGIADAGNITLSAVSGNAFGAIVIWADSGSVDTSRLIAYIDTGTGLPASPNSGDIEIQWSNGASSIFQL